MVCFSFPLILFLPSASLLSTISPSLWWTNRLSSIYFWISCTLLMNKHIPCVKYLENHMSFLYITLTTALDLILLENSIPLN